MEICGLFLAEKPCEGLVQAVSTMVKNLRQAGCEGFAPGGKFVVTTSSSPQIMDIRRVFPPDVFKHNMD
jgi:hypothetical protein